MRAKITERERATLGSKFRSGLYIRSDILVFWIPSRRDITTRASIDNKLGARRLPADAICLGRYSEPIAKPEHLFWEDLAEFVEVVPTVSPPAADAAPTEGTHAMNTETTETPLNRNDEPATIAALAAVAKELLKLVAARAKHENPGEYFEADSRLKSGECFPRVTIDFRHGEHTVAVKSVNDSDGEDDHLLGQFDSRKASLNS